METIETLDVAQALHGTYEKLYGKPLKEPLMQKYMYLIQRESLLRKDERLFKEDFYAGKCGPWLTSVQKEFTTENPFNKDRENISEETQELINIVLYRYGEMTPWRLSSMIHGEISWSSARKGLLPTEDGSVKMRLIAMRIDAAREKVKRKTQ